MKPTRFLLSAALMGLSTLAFAQSDAQKSFNQLKSLAGSREGTMEGKPMHVIASRHFHGKRPHA